VEGHPLLVELLVAQLGQRDLDELLEEVAKKEGDFAAKIEKVHSWSASRLDASGQAAWKALPLFPAGNAPEAVLRAAVGKQGLEDLRKAALADFDQSEQLWHWHSTVAEYARSHWPLTQAEQRSQRLALLPAWSEWIKRKSSGEKKTLLRLESSRHNLVVMAEDCAKAPQEGARAFLEDLDARLPSPERTLALRELVVAVCNAKLLVLPADDRAERGRLLSNLGVALSALGRRGEALNAAKEAADIYRNLAEKNPEAFLPDLAMSLNNLGNSLSALGRRAEAMNAAKEAADIRCKLAEKNPEAFLPDLAGSLNNLGNSLSALGRRAEALNAAKEAADIYRKLAEKNPEAFLPDLAMSLNNLGNSLSALGRRAEAMNAAKEAADICRKLAEKNPQAFLPDLAMSLGSYGRVLLKLESYDEAAKAFAEGLQHIVPFHRKLPQAFSSLAHALRSDYMDACQKAGLEPDMDLLSQFE
jgi:tetratricopeptide (TPR) repeat protein